MKCTHISTTLGCDIKKAFAFLAVPENLPKYSSFVRQVYRDRSDIIGVSALGPQKHEFVTNEALGVIDIVVHEPNGYLLHVPNRLIANEKGCEYVTTIFHAPMISDKEYQEWISLIHKEHERLNTLLAA